MWCTRHGVIDHLLHRYVMTGGQYGISVIGTEFYRQFFTNRNFGYGAAIAIVLFIAISPVLVYNLRQLGQQEGF